jgi:hypothetical protein
MRKTVIALIVALSFPAVSHAVPWCHRGYPTQIADITLADGDAVLDAWNGSPALPANQSDPDAWIASHTSAKICSTYASAPNSLPPHITGEGSMNTIIYAPYALTNSPWFYQVEMGMRFRCIKCYDAPRAISNDPPR